jgi:hypothetical protein
MMHILYLDDSGSPHNANEEYFVLGGVCVPERSLRWLSYELEKLVQTLTDAPEDVELHAVDIFGGRTGIWREMRERPARITVIKQVLSVLDKAYPDVITFACAIHKASFTGDPVRQAFEEISSRFDRYLKRLNGAQAVKERREEEHRGLIVMDKSTYETSLQGLAATFRQEGNRWGQYLTGICEVPLFVDSKSSRIVQLADHVAYAVFRRYNASDLTYYNCIEGRFDQEDGVIHGLVHRKPRNQLCTCPACLTRARR